MEKHVPSLELCEKLKAAGYPRDGHFIWCEGEVIPEKDLLLKSDESEIYPAPLATELLERLPNNYEAENGEVRFWFITHDKLANRYVIYYEGRKTEPYMEALSLPDALASMWILLKKNKYL